MLARKGEFICRRYVSSQDSLHPSGRVHCVCVVTHVIQACVLGLSRHQYVLSKNFSCTSIMSEMNVVSKAIHNEIWPGQNSVVRMGSKCHQTVRDEVLGN